MKLRFLILPLILIVAFFALTGRVLKTRPGRELPASIAERTKTEEREALDPERARKRDEAIAAAAKRWHQELLEKYPQMRPAYREVPDADNGYLQYLLLLERTGERRVPEDLYLRITGGTAWDSAAFQRWFDENADYLEEILRIAELPDRSAKGIAPARVFGNPARFSGEPGAVLTGAARLAIERGDHEFALRLITAVLNLGSHLSGIEEPTALGRVIAAGYESAVWSTFRESVLPVIAGDADLLRKWSAALAPRESAAEVYARTMTGEWNVILQMHLLPGLLGGDPVDSGLGAHLPSVDAFAPAFLAMQETAAQGVMRQGAGRFDVEGAVLKIPPGEHDRATLQFLEFISFSMKGLPAAFGAMETRHAMDRAAISILLGEEPPVDPVSGEAFHWDAESRTLSAPGDTGAIDSILLPRG